MVHPKQQVRATKVSELAIRDFLGEIKVMAPLNHPNLVGLYGGCWTDGPDKLCIVLEFCPKGSMKGLLQSAKVNDYTWAEPYDVLTPHAPLVLTAAARLSPIITATRLSAANHRGARSSLLHSHTAHVS